MIQSPWGKDKIEYLANNLAKDVLSINGFRGDIVNNIYLDSIQLTDDNGVWLQINNIELNWNLWPLFSGRLEINDFSIQNIKFLRQPIFQNSSSSEQNLDLQSLAWPVLPLNIDCQDINISDINIQKQIIGKQINYKLHSSLKYKISNLEFNLKLSGIKNSLGSIAINFNADHKLNLQLESEIIPAKYSLYLLQKYAELDLKSVQPIKLKAKGTPKKIDFIVDLGVDNLFLPQLQIKNLQTEFEGVLQDGLSLCGKLSLQAHQLNPHELVFNDFQIKSDIKLLNTKIYFNNLWATSREAELYFPGQVEINSKQIGIAGNLEVKRFNLAALEPYLGQNWGGVVRSKIETQGSLDKLQISLSGQIDDFRSSVPQLKDLAGRQLRFQSKLDLNMDQVKWSDFSVQAEQIDLQSQGLVAWEQEQIDISAMADISNLDSLDKNINGRANIYAHLTGRLSSPKLYTSAVCPLLLLKKQELNNVFSKISLDIGKQTGNLITNFDYGQDKVFIDSYFSWLGQSFNLSDFSVTGLGLSGQGGGELDFKTGLGSAQINLQGSELDRLSALLGTDLSGSFAAQTALRWNKESVQADFKLAGDKLALSSEAGKGRVRLKADISGPMTNPEFKADLDLDNLDLSSQAQLKKTNISLHGTLDHAELTAQVKGNAGLPFEVDSRSELRLGFDGQDIGLKFYQFNGQLAGKDFKLLAPARFNLKGHALGLSNFKLKLGQGLFSAQADVDDKKIDAKLDIKNLSTSWLAMFLPVEDKGRITTNFICEGSPQNPIVNIDFSCQGLKPILDEDYAPVNFNIKGNAKYSQQEFKFRSELGGMGKKPLLIEIKAPLKLNLQPRHLSADWPGRGNAFLQGDVDLNWIPAILGQDEHIVQAIAHIDVKADWYKNAPHLGGQVTVQNGEYEYLRSGTVLRNIAAKLKLDNEDIAFKLDATDGAQGRVEVDSVCTLHGEFPFDARLNSHNLQAMNLDNLRAMIDGRLQAKGNKHGLLFSGKMQAAPVHIRVPEQSPPELVTLQVEEVNGTQPVSGKDQAKISANKYPVDLDISLSLPNQIFIRGRGLDSEWKGNIEVSGSIAKPVLEGSFEVIRGTYSFAGRNFVFSRGEQGKIQFLGDYPPDPALDLSAEATIDDLTAEILVQGTASDFSLELSSDPVLPTDEILSRILFGRSLESITPMQAFKLAQTIQNLRGGGGGMDIMSRVRKFLGVDNLEVGMGQGENSGVNVGVGKYLTDNIYVEIDKSSVAEEDSVAVEVELDPNLSLDGTLGGDSSGKVELKWKKDY